MDNIKANIAKNIIELRKKNNWTQAELADKLNYSDKAVSKWERAEAVPDIETLHALAELFGVTVDYFLYYGKQVQQEYVVPKIENLFQKLAILFLSCIVITSLALLLFVLAIYQAWPWHEHAWLIFVVATPILCTCVSLFFLFNKVWLGSVISVSLIPVFIFTSVYLFLFFIEGKNFWLMWLFLPFVVGAIILLFFMNRKSKRNKKTK